MKHLSRLIISLLAVFLFSCEKHALDGYRLPLAFTYEGVNLTKHKIKGSDLYGYTGTVPASGATLILDITSPHDKFCNYSMISRVTLDDVKLEKPYHSLELPEDGIEYSGGWGKIQTEVQKDYITTIVLNPNNTGKTREMTIHFSYTWYVATITLKQEK